jgi:hypothetical protein
MSSFYDLVEIEAITPEMMPSFAVSLQKGNARGEMSAHTAMKCREIETIL